MTRLLGVLVALCSIAAACGSSDTTAGSVAPLTSLAPAADPETEDPDVEPADAAPAPRAPEEADTTTTIPEPEADPDPEPEPEPEPAEDPIVEADPTTTTPEPAPEPEPAEDPVTEEADTTTTTTPPTTTTTTTPPPTTTAPPTTTTPPPTTTTTTAPAPLPERLPADPEAPAREWVAGINAAGWGFHRHLTGNAVSSPVSIGVAFSLSRAGASPDSGAALDKIFGFPADGAHSAANAVDLSLAEGSVEPTILEVANRLFPDDGFTMRPEFQRTAAAHYGATVDPVDTADGAAAADIINRWVSRSTRGLIPRIVDAGAVQGQQLVLVNTVYLKADWLVPFLPDLTSDGQFTTGDNRSVKVPFMRDRVPFTRRYVLLDGADAVELPYQGGELAMWLIVPRDPAGLAAVEASLDAGALTGLPNAAKAGLVDLTMPKWEQTLPPADLFAWLCPQGFCPGAAFDAIAPGIFISAALHGAKVIVDEKGTEAAAATSMMFPTSAPPRPDLTIVADRPFLWAIVHQDTGALLFVGRLVDPTA